jgi:hypothetical protein
VIVNNKVVGAYDSTSNAYYASIKKYEPGTFLIQRCSEGDKDYTQHFHSRVVFA